MGGSAVMNRAGSGWLALLQSSKTGDQEIKGSYDFVSLLFERAHFITKVFNRNSGKFSR
jgi:hypothetical protein